MSDADTSLDQPADQEETSVTVRMSAVEWQLLSPVLLWLRSLVERTPEVLPAATGNAFCIDERFADAFAMRLRLFHVLHSPAEAMSKKAFEFAFEFSARAAGHLATLDPSATTPEADIMVGGAGFSLKTEASQGISRTHVVISKLMESLWTKHCETIADFLNGIRDHVLPRINHSQRIFVLRAFGRIETDGMIEYELLEVPRHLLLAIGGVRAADFSPLTGANGTSAPVVYNGTSAFTLVFDGSDQKITIRRLLVSQCIVHARWTIRPPSTIRG
jgi:hypothetical protein